MRQIHGGVTAKPQGINNNALGSGRRSFGSVMAYHGITATEAGLQAMGGGDLAAGLAGRLARVRVGAPVVILVHGYKFHPGVPATDPHRSLYAFRPVAGNRRIRSWPVGLGIAEDEGETGLAIGFAWPAAAP